MLFLDPDFMRKGYGKQILTSLIKEHKIQYIDVNEQNQLARKFYTVLGFELYKRSELDEAGRAYPILHLRKK